MKVIKTGSWLVFLVILLACSESGFAQSRTEIESGKIRYEKSHPTEKTYLISDLIPFLDPADTIMPNARSVTFEEWEKIGGAMFGVIRQFNAKGSHSKDEFTIKYFKDDAKLKRLVTEYILTDASSFKKFMDEHRENGFYKVTLWKAGYLMFYMLEGREKKTGINLIVVPVKPQIFEEI